MRLICPRCAAQYEIAGDLIPETGREVECSACACVWLARRGDLEETATPPTREPLAAQARHTGGLPDHSNADPRNRDDDLTPRPFGNPDSQPDEDLSELLPIPRLQRQLPQDVLSVLLSEAARERSARQQARSSRERAAPGANHADDAQPAPEDGQAGDPTREGPKAPTRALRDSSRYDGEGIDSASPERATRDAQHRDNEGSPAPQPQSAPHHSRDNTQSFSQIARSNDEQTGSAARRSTPRGVRPADGEESRTSEGTARDGETFSTALPQNAPHHSGDNAQPEAAENARSDGEDPNAASPQSSLRDGGPADGEQPQSASRDLYHPDHEPPASQEHPLVTDAAGLPAIEAALWPATTITQPDDSPPRELSRPAQDKARTEQPATEPQADRNHTDNAPPHAATITDEGRAAPRHEAPPATTPPLPEPPPRRPLRPATLPDAEALAATLETVPPETPAPPPPAAQRGGYGTGIALGLSLTAVAVLAYLAAAPRAHAPDAPAWITAPVAAIDSARAGLGRIIAGSD